MIYDKTFRNRITKKFQNTSRWGWPSVVHLVCSPYAKYLCAMIEDIYCKYPFKKDGLRQRLRSFEEDNFMGAFYELITFDFFKSRQFTIKEFYINRKKPDYLLRYPRGRNCILEVTSITPYDKTERITKAKVIELISTIDKEMNTTNYGIWVGIPTQSGQVPSVDLSALLFDMRRHMKRQSIKKSFVCSDGSIKVNIHIISRSLAKGKVIGFNHFLADSMSKKDFQTRLYNQIRKKIRKYKEIKKLPYPFVITLYIRGLYFNDNLQTSLYGPSPSVKKSKGKRVVFKKSDNRILSGVILMNTISSRGLFSGRKGQHDFVIEPEIYCHPKPYHKIDMGLYSLIESDINSAKTFVEKLRNDDVFYRDYVD